MTWIDDRDFEGTRDRVAVTRSATAADVKARIESAFADRARAEAEQITVECRGSGVILRGFVRSWDAKDTAGQAACSTPGVAHVTNDIIVNPL